MYIYTFMYICIYIYICIHISCTVYKGENTSKNDIAIPN